MEPGITTCADAGLFWLAASFALGALCGTSITATLVAVIQLHRRGDHE
jgi:hypothetical protein